MSMSRASTSAIDIAFRAASEANDTRDSPSPRTCLLLIPVRDAIQSSLVSINWYLHFETRKSQ